MKRTKLIVLFAAMLASLNFAPAYGEDDPLNIAKGSCQVPDCREYKMMFQRLNQAEAQLNYAQECFVYRKGIDNLFAENYQERIEILDAQIANEKLVINTVEVGVWTARLSTELILALTGGEGVSVIGKSASLAIETLLKDPKFYNDLATMVQGTGSPVGDGDAIRRGLGVTGVLTGNGDLIKAAITNEFASVVKAEAGPILDKKLDADKKKLVSLNHGVISSVANGDVKTAFVDALGETAGNLLEGRIDAVLSAFAEETVGQVRPSPVALREALKNALSLSTVKNILKSAASGLKGIGPSAVHAYVNSIQDQRRAHLKKTEQEKRRFEQKLKEREALANKYAGNITNILELLGTKLPNQREAIEGEASYCELKQNESCVQNHEKTVRVAKQRLREVRERVYQRTKELKAQIQAKLAETEKLAPTASENTDNIPGIANSSREQKRLRDELQKIVDDANKQLSEAQASAEAIIRRANSTLASCVSNDTTELPALQFPELYQDPELCDQYYRDAVRTFKEVEGHTFQPFTKTVESCDASLPIDFKLEPLSEECSYSAFPLSQIEQYDNLAQGGGLRAPKTYQTACQTLVEDEDIFDDINNQKHCQFEAETLTAVERKRYNLGVKIHQSMLNFNSETQALCDLESVQKNGATITYAEYIKDESRKWILFPNSSEMLRQYDKDYRAWLKKRQRLGEEAGIPPKRPRYVGVTGQSVGLNIADQIDEKTEAINSLRFVIKKTKEEFDETDQRIDSQYDLLTSCEKAQCPVANSWGALNTVERPNRNDPHWQRSARTFELGPECVSACGVLERRFNSGLDSLFNKHIALSNDLTRFDDYQKAELHRKSVKLVERKQELDDCISKQCPAEPPPKERVGDVLDFELIRITPLQGNNPFNSVAPLSTDGSVADGGSGNGGGTSGPINNFLASCIGNRSVQTMGANHNVAIFANSSPAACEVIVSNMGTSSFPLAALVFHGSGLRGDNTVSISGNSAVTVTPILPSAGTSISPNAVANPAAGFVTFDQTFTVETRVDAFPQFLLRFTINVFIEERESGDVPDRFNDLTVTIVNAEVL